MALVTAPENENEILPKLGESAQRLYYDYKTKMQQVTDRLTAKGVSVDTGFYTKKLEYALGAAEDLQELYNKENLNTAQLQLKEHRIRERWHDKFYKEYPVFPASQEPAEIARAHANKKLEDALGPKGMMDTVFDAVRDPDTGKVLWGNIAGGGMGLLLGGLMGNYISGAAGGGMLGMAATVLLALSGMVFGTKVMDHFTATPTPATTPTLTPAIAPAPGKGVEKSEEKPVAKDDDKKAAREATPRDPKTVLQASAGDMLRAMDTHTAVLNHQQTGVLNNYPHIRTKIPSGPDGILSSEEFQAGVKKVGLKNFLEAMDTNKDGVADESEARKALQDARFKVTHPIVGGLDAAASRLMGELAIAAGAETTTPHGLPNEARPIKVPGASAPTKS